MTKKHKVLSKCCYARVVIGGKWTTHYYVCTKCNKPCDVEVKDDSKTPNQPE